MNMNKETDRLIMTKDLNMKEDCLKLVPKDLKSQRQQNKWEIASDPSVRLLGLQTFGEKIVTDGETCGVFQYYPERRCQSLQWKSPEYERL